ncbi:MAG: DNA topoisomerase I [Nanoarchaeota archaeon]|nr:DNA topoisomerase I [Nanoarchaeota archaeon]
MRRKPPKKTKEEKIAENYFPVSKDDLRYAIEKEYKNSNTGDLQKIEFSSKAAYSHKEKRKARKTTKNKLKKSVKKSKTKIEFTPPKITLKKNGYELIITEKPQAAMKISSALGDSTKNNFQRVPYYEIDRQGKKIVVACAVGHLFTLKQNTPGSKVPVFDISWVPNFIAKKNDFTKKYYDTLLRLAKNAGSITVATDYDVEGEVIGLNIVRFVCGQKDAGRMKFSTLTEKELNKSYDEKASNLNWGQAIAGETRHYLDWIYGINLSRALMNSLKSIGKFKIMSIGRVQGPTLKLIVEKEKKIQAFKPEPYWQAFIFVKNSHEIELKHNKDISKKSKLKNFEILKGENIQINTKKKQQTIPPNSPFNLTTLQTEAYRFYGITPARTLQIAQSLYLAGLISYPRTSSQKLPDSISYKEILEKISKKYKVEELMVRKKPVEGKKSDPAHPSIYPTGQENHQILPEDEEKIYNLIEKRFLSLFCDDAIIDNKRIEGEINGLKFLTTGSSIKKKTWMEIYPVKLKEKELPDLNGEFKIKNVRTEEKQTQPPKRYSPASIVSTLEKRNLGTKATRTSILETLYNRNYIRERSIEATPLGMSLIETLEKYSPIITDEELTRNFEKEMELIRGGKNNFLEKKQKVLEKAKKTITKIAKQFEKHEKKIGQEILEANIILTKQMKEENTLNICPVCKKGNLAITYSKKNRKYFVACNAYPECRTTFSLPPNGLIKISGKNCEDCEFPMLIRISRGRRPWEFCFNPKCVKNKERIEKYKKKKKEE